MANEANYKWKCKRDKHRVPKPYARPLQEQSLVRRVASSVTDMLVPKWMKSYWSSGHDTDLAEEDMEHLQAERQENNLAASGSGSGSGLAVDDIDNRLPERFRMNHENQIAVHDTEKRFGNNVSLRRSDLNQPKLRQSVATVSKAKASLGLGGTAEAKGSRPINSVEAEDEGSSSSEASSTSGCSSLVPSNHQDNQHLTRLNLPQTGIENIRKDLMRNISQETRDIGTGTELKSDANITAKGQEKKSFLWSNSSVKQFDVTKFSSSASLLPQVSRRSPFYEGKTTFGGASTRRAARLSSANPYNVSAQRVVPRKVQVNNLRSMESTGDLSNAAKRILASMEKISSPLEDAKRIPLYESSPSSRLLETRNRPFQRLAGHPPSLSMVVPSKPAQIRSQPLSTWTLKLKDNQPTEKRGDFFSQGSIEGKGGGGKMKSKVPKSSGRIPKIVEEETPKQPELPNVPLTITQLPSFNFPKTSQFQPTFEAEPKHSASMSLQPLKPTTIITKVPCEGDDGEREAEDDEFEFKFSKPMSIKTDQDPRASLGSPIMLAMPRPISVTISKTSEPEVPPVTPVTTSLSFGLQATSALGMDQSVQNNFSSTNSCFLNVNNDVNTETSKASQPALFGLSQTAPQLPASSSNLSFSFGSPQIKPIQTQAKTQVQVQARPASPVEKQLGIELVKPKPIPMSITKTSEPEVPPVTSVATSSLSLSFGLKPGSSPASNQQQQQQQQQQQPIQNNFSSENSSFNVKTDTSKASPPSLFGQSGLQLATTSSSPPFCFGSPQNITIQTQPTSFIQQQLQPTTAGEMAKPKSTTTSKTIETTVKPSVAPVTSSVTPASTLNSSLTIGLKTTSFGLNQSFNVNTEPGKASQPTLFGLAPQQPVVTSSLFSFGSPANLPIQPLNQNQATSIVQLPTAIDLAKPKPTAVSKTSEPEVPSVTSNTTSPLSFGSKASTTTGTTAVFGLNQPIQNNFSSTNSIFNVKSSPNKASQPFLFGQSAAQQPVVSSSRPFSFGFSQPNVTPQPQPQAGTQPTSFVQQQPSTFPGNSTISQPVQNSFSSANSTFNANNDPGKASQPFLFGQPAAQQPVASSGTPFSFGFTPQNIPIQPQAQSQPTSFVQQPPSSFSANPGLTFNFQQQQPGPAFQSSAGGSLFQFTAQQPENTFGQNQPASRVIKKAKRRLNQPNK